MCLFFVINVSKTLQILNLIIRIDEKVSVGMNFVLGDMSLLFGNGLSVLVLLQEFIGRSFMFTDIANLLLLVISM